MSAFLLVWVLYASGEWETFALLRPSVEACEAQRPSAKANLQKLSDMHPGTIRMFAMSCAASEFVETRERS
jgi:hypothetical protein